MSGWLRGAAAQWSEHLQLKQEVLGSITGGCPVLAFSCMHSLQVETDN